MKLNFLKYGAYVLIVALSVEKTLCASQEVGPVDGGGLYRTKSKSYVVNRADSIKERADKEQTAYKKALAEGSTHEQGRLKFSETLPAVILYAQDGPAGKPKPKKRSNTLKNPRPPIASYDLDA